MAEAAWRRGQLLGRGRTVGTAEGRGGRSGEVLRAAARLFAERGYHGTNMAEIARALGLGAPALYNHIASKHALLAEICLSTMGRALEVQEEAIAGADEIERLRRAAQAHVRFVVANRAEALVADREFIHLEPRLRAKVQRLRRKYEGTFRSLIAAGDASGRFHVQEPKLASFAIIEMGTSVAEWFRERGPAPLDTGVREYGDYALRLAGYVR